MQICIGAGIDATDYACFETKVFLPYTVSSGCVDPITVAFNSCAVETRDTVDEEVLVEKILSLESSLIGMGNVHIEEVDGAYVALGEESSSYIELTLAPAKEAAAAVTPIKQIPANEAMATVPLAAGVRGNRRRGIKPNSALSRFLKVRRARPTSAPTSAKKDKPSSSGQNGKSASSSKGSSAAETSGKGSSSKSGSAAETSGKGGSSKSSSATATSKGGSSVKRAKSKSSKGSKSSQPFNNSTGGGGSGNGGNNSTSGGGGGGGVVSNSTQKGIGRSLAFTSDDCTETCIEVNGGVIDDDGVGDDDEFVCVRAQAIDGDDVVVRIAYTVRDGNGVSASFSIPVTVSNSGFCLPPLSTCENPTLDLLAASISRPTISPTFRPTVPPSAAPFKVAVISNSGQAATGNRKRGRGPRG